MPLIEWPPVLTIREPYIGAIVAGRKPYEFRSWTVSHRGPLFLHRGAKGGHEPAIIGVCWLADIRLTRDVATVENCPDPTILSRYQWAWHLKNAAACPPIRINGRLGLWRLDALAFTREETRTLRGAMRELERGRIRLVSA